MPRRCSVCDHESRQEIDQALIECPDSIRDLAGQYRVSKSSLQRHRETHIPQALAKARSAKQASQADRLLARLDDLEARLMRALDAAEGEGDYRSIAALSREVINVSRLLAEISGRLKNGQINVSVETQGAPALVQINTDPSHQVSVLELALRRAKNRLGIQAPNGQGGENGQAARLGQSPPAPPIIETSAIEIKP